MVGTSPPSGLRSFRHQRRSSVDVKTVNQLRISATRHDPKGLDVRELFSPSAEGGVFSLDIPFYRTRPLEEHADRRPAPRTTAQKRKPTTPRIYNLSGRPAVAAVT